MARGLASEFAPHNIRVNVVSPGSIDTRRDHPEWYHGRLPNAVGVPLGRQGTVDEIAATCLFLVSEDPDRRSTSMAAHTITDLRSYASGVWPVPRPHRP